MIYIYIIHLRKINKTNYYYYGDIFDICVNINICIHIYIKRIIKHHDFLKKVRCLKKIYVYDKLF